MAKLSQLDDRIEIRQNFAPVPNIFAKPEEIQQVFFNVIRNGIQAMTGKEGVLEITTTPKTAGLHPYQIRERGSSRSTFGKIFDPFFTTKAGRRPRPGMYIVQKIINKYGGDIRLESRLGKGTTVIIRFPGLKPA